MRCLRWSSLGAALAGLLIGALAGRALAAPAPADPQPADSALRPGLAVDYYYEYYRQVRELIDWMGYKDPEPGEPLPQLNYRVGTGRVLTSQADDGVGAHIRGFIRLDQLGTYSFALRSNDGVRLSIGGEQILEDPDVHSDRYTVPEDVVVETPGWYAIELLYFERRNTSTLELYWLRPGEAEDKGMSLVPAEAFAHLPAD